MDVSHRAAKSSLLSWGIDLRNSDNVMLETISFDIDLGNKKISCDVLPNDIGESKSSMTKNLHDIRLQNLAKLIENFELGPGNRAAFCRAYGFDPLQMGQYFTESDHGRKMGERKARSIETKIGLNAGWLDKDHSNTNDVSSRPNHNNEAPTKSVPKISLIYADDEEIEMLTAYREATELGKNLFRAAMKNAPRDIERLKTLRKVPAT